MANTKKKLSDKEEFLKKFGAHIKKLRMNKDMSGAELASLCELPRSNISRLENGNANLTIYSLKRISEALEIEMDEILKGFK